MARWRALAALVAIVSAAPLAAQPDPRAALVERAAWEALAAGRADAAADGFRQALARDPKNARLHLGAGMAAALARRDGDARDELERALQLNPALSSARALLGQMRYRLGDLDGAIREYETLAPAAPDDRDVAEALARWRREAELRDRMQQNVGAHFTVSFEGPEQADLARRAVDALEEAYWRIGGILGTYPTAPIAVVLYTTEQFKDITRSPSWAAGAYDGIIRVPVAGALDQPKELDRVLAHEFTHALVRTLAESVPTWLNEGLAAAFESSDLGWAETRVRQARGRLPLDRLNGSFGRLTGSQAQLAYATSAVAVHRLVDEAGGFAVANLLRDLGAGVDFEAAFEHRIQRSFADFQARLAEE